MNRKSPNAPTTGATRSPSKQTVNIKKTVTIDNNLEQIKSRHKISQPNGFRLVAAGRTRISPTTINSARQQQQQQQQQQPQLLKPQALSQNDRNKCNNDQLELSGETTDDNYESANECDDNTYHQPTKTPKSPPTGLKLNRPSPTKIITPSTSTVAPTATATITTTNSSSSSLTSSSSTTHPRAVASSTTAPSSSSRPVRRPNFVIERRNPSKPTNNLTRGKQQRASISSCSSNDSYASYGSGYASGSGNSTDHEQKLNSLTNAPKVNQKALNNASTNDEQSQPSNMLNQPPNPIVKAKEGLESFDREINTCDKTNGIVNEHDPEAGAEEDEEDNNSDLQLRRHLSELEQLTDDLANRNIFQSDTRELDRKSSVPDRDDAKIYSSSSVISTDSQSNLSSLSSAIGELVASKSEVDRKPKSPSKSPNTTRANSEARSDSVTPTTLSINQSNCSAKDSNTVSVTGQKFNLLQLQSSNMKANRTPTKCSTLIDSRVHLSPSILSKSDNTSSSLCNNLNETNKQDTYYHNLFQWEQLESKGVSRPLLINDLDFTDLRDEDDCDLLNSSVPSNGVSMTPKGHDQSTGEPLHINIPGQKSLNGTDNQDMVDSGTGTGPNSNSPTNGGCQTPASAPPPMPPPPMSPWLNNISGGSRPQSQLLLSPTPSIDVSRATNTEPFNREQSPVDSMYSNYSRNSFCVPHTSTPSRELSNNQFNNIHQTSSLRSASSMSSLLFGSNGKCGNKRKKTMKLFWKEVREDRSLLSKLTKKKTIWDDIKPVPIDTQRLEYLFESKAKDLSLSRSRNGLDGSNQRKAKITVLDAKRSNAINIGMTKLPPMRTIKSAILKMDSSIMNREGIEKILTTMMPTEEEKSRIIEAQLANPDTPLGTAEQFLLNLASISALEARLKLWAFQLDYAQIEKEVAEPLMDLKQAIDEIERSETFRIILGTLLSIGNFLNCSNAKGFQIEYLEKVPEVKDTVHKHSLLHHLCLFIQERFDFTTDLYSEFSAVNRASKIDYVEVGKSLKKMQHDCKASWDHLKIVAKHDGLANLMNTSTTTSSSASSSCHQSQLATNGAKPCGKLNNLSKLSMITTVTSCDTSPMLAPKDLALDGGTQSSNKQMKTKVSDFLTDCAERIMVLMVIHRRVINRFHKLLIYLGCAPNQIKQTQPQQILKMINEFALEYRTKRERVKELLMKRQNCQHGSQANASRWQLGRTRWSGSQQCIDSSNRPSSTASSYANGFSCAGCCLKNLNASQLNGSLMRPGSPSSLSNYSDYLNDQASCCQSRHQSVTPVPPGSGGQQRPQSISVSMLDLENQRRQSSAKTSRVSFDESCFEKKGDKASDNCDLGHDGQDGDQIQRRKNEQLRQLLGVGKSFDGACSDLLKMSHWTSTSNRVLRHQPPSLYNRKQRAASIDSTPKDELNARQSSYYKLDNYKSRCMDDELEQNSDEEILQCLVRTATGRTIRH